MKRMKTLGWVELILSLLLIGAGIYSFVNPSAALTGVTAVYGIAALITGIADIVFYVKLEQRTGFAPVMSLVGGIVSIIAGLLILFNITAGAWALVILFPIWFIAHCIARLAHLPFVRLFAGNGYYVFSLIVNILGLIWGILMFVKPFVSLFSFSYMIGFYLIFLGIDSLVFALSLLSSRN